MKTRHPQATHGYLAFGSHFLFTFVLVIEPQENKSLELIGVWPAKLQKIGKVHQRHDFVGERS
jgi:hypothetical protein